MRKSHEDGEPPNEVSSHLREGEAGRGPQGSTVCQVHFECFSSLRGSAANPSVVAGWRVHSSVLLANPIGRYMLVCSDYFIILKMNKNKYRTSTWFSNSS